MGDIEYEIFYEETKDIDVYFHSEFEDIKGFLPGKTKEEIIKTFKKINKCTCGGDIELHEYECMGDGGYDIVCKKCGRRMRRSQYDQDITKWEDVLDFCIRDWNDGYCDTDVEEANQKEIERKLLTMDDVSWNTWYANNIIQNPIEGEYCLLFAKDSKGKLFCVKWTIAYQEEEIEPMCIGENIESYNLFVKRYYDFSGPLEYPKPSNVCMDIVEKEDTLYSCGVNDEGYFIRNYKTLEEAKKGAIARSGQYGINKDTIIKDTKGKTSKDFE